MSMIVKMRNTCKALYKALSHLRGNAVALFDKLLVRARQDYLTSSGTGFNSNACSATSCYSIIVTEILKCIVYILLSFPNDVQTLSRLILLSAEGCIAI